MSYYHWEELTLDGYLSRVEMSFLGKAITYTKTFTETSELPKAVVGLARILLYGWKSSENQPDRELVVVPDRFEGEDETEFIREVEAIGQHLKSTDVSNWQEHLLLNLGYATVRTHSAVNVSTDRAALFNPIPEEERGHLLEKYGMHKIATMVAHGHTQNLDSLISTIDEVRGDANYLDVFKLVRFGVPWEDFPLALQLPEDMVRGIYTYNRSRKELETWTTT